MQRFLVPAALGLALAAAAAPASAQSLPQPQSRPMSFYTTLSGGISHASIDCSGVATCQRNGTAFKLIGGWNINDGLSAEITYDSLGTAKIADSGVSMSVKGSFVGLGLAGHYDIDSNFAALVRGGVASGSSTTTGSVAGVGSVSQTRSGTAHYYYGLGARVYLTRNWRLDLDYDHTRVASMFGNAKSTNGVNAFMAGGSYAF